MLILTRRVGENLIIDEEVVVKALEINGNQIRFGVDAPNDISIHREEVFERIKAKENNKDSAILRLKMADHEDSEGRTEVLLKGEIFGYLVKQNPDSDSYVFVSVNPDTPLTGDQYIAIGRMLNRKKRREKVKATRHVR